VTRWLRYWARTVRPGVSDPLGQLAFVIRWERGEIGEVPSSQSRNHASGTGWPRRRAVEFRKGRGNDRSLLAQKKRRANRRDAVAVRPEINVHSLGRLSPAESVLDVGIFQEKAVHRRPIRYTGSDAISCREAPEWLRWKANQTQHLLILYDIYCLMLLEWLGLQVRPHVRSEKVVKGSPRGVNLVSAPSA
jgi:hypothetical protein